MTQYQTPEPIAVALELGVGDVHIAASDRADTVVEVRPRDPADASDVSAAERVRVDFSHGVLRVTGPKVWFYDFSRKTRTVDVSIELPSGSHVSSAMQMGDLRGVGRLGECRLKTTSGSFWLERTGALRLATSAGHVSADGIAGDAEISTGTGKIHVGAVEGNAVVKNSNGDTSIDAISGDVRVRAANGNIHVERAGAGVDAKTSNGNIHLGEVARGPIVLGTDAGHLEIGIAQGSAAWLELDTGFGRVRNLMDRASGPEESDETVEVRGRTAYGDITVRRA